ncbi:MAG TPA: DUF2889 domain-containing protein [Burkholderiaceae bacterium]|nr:DUF2889 domain-containing protein [Burkholderiaceae bacterium]
MHTIDSVVLGLPEVANQEVFHTDHDLGWVLPPPEARERVHTRSIVCRGFRRSDGLFDIEGRFIDTRPFAYHSESRGETPAGRALHHMQVRLTIDSERVIRELVSAMPATPHWSCPEVNRNFQRLVGVSIAKGFKQVLRERLGRIEACTHMIGLLEAMAAAALQTFSSATHAPRPGSASRPARVWKIDALIDTCYAYRRDGPMLEERARRATVTGEGS